MICLHKDTKKSFSSLSMSLLIDYHDALVYAPDLGLLRPGQWLNDRLINFCFRYFEFADPVPPNNILLLDPCVVSYLAIQCCDPSDFQDLYTSLKLREKEYLFLPCSDSMDFESSSTHWSLVVYHVPSNTAVHVDSYNGYNNRSARNLVTKITQLYRCFEILYVTNHGCLTEFLCRFEKDVELITPKTPQQTNGYDCGVYVILSTLFIVEGFMKGIQSLADIVQGLNRVTPTAVADYRQVIARDIERLSGKMSS